MKMKLFFGHSIDGLLAFPGKPLYRIIMRMTQTPFGISVIFYRFVCVGCRRKAGLQMAADL